MKIYSALNSIEKLYFHNVETEADIQCQLFSRLKKDGFSVKVGVNIRKGMAGAGCQFDLVIHQGKRAIAIIEVKSSLEGPQVDLDSTHQGLKYRSFGIPVVLFWSMENYPDLKNFLRCLLTSEIPKDKIEVKPLSRNTESYARLRQSLDIASMRAFDLGMHELEKDLEQKRDSIAVQMS